MLQQTQATPVQEPSIGSRLLAAVGYLPAMFVIVLAVQRDEGFCRHHASQSAILLAALFIAWAAIQLFDLAVGRFLGGVFFIGFVFKGLGWLVRNIGGLIVSTAYLLLAVLGMVNAAAGQRWTAPAIGSLPAWLKASLSAGRKSQET